MPNLEFLRPDTAQATEPALLTRHDEGELAVDVYENTKAIFVKTAIAGVKPEDLSLSLTADMLTIKGKRHDEHAPGEGHQYLTRECHWGQFSRAIILPAEINVVKAEAIFKSGILVIKLPKVSQENNIKLKVEEE